MVMEVLLKYLPGTKLSYGGKVQTGIGERAGTVLFDPKNITVADKSSYDLIIGYNYQTYDKSINQQTIEDADSFGNSVSLDGNRLAVGSLWDDGV